ncbi:hypothetical protein GM415_17210 [Pseudodesulfovibrio cashew]|uniref:Ysc84 actin-binding domain-containing protein n=1 Tax=Pseudodesulfovibrio cashew TaxID=2678688 RepID=A0A6I6JG17_9BACT|nr:lipid-binding SYLF domain-containing protein [Pseudodesulfovibrio cashew]QGY41786.1 hypothetical protein GM415_17210 [Pseudodesulfovibrio cashew]
MHMQQRLSFLAAAFVAVLLCGCAGRSTAPREMSAAQSIVDQATAVVRKQLEGPNREAVEEMIRDAQGMLIIPAMGNVSFFFSVGGGNAIAMARTPDGWSGPAFLSKGTGGVGLQAGVTRTSGIIFYMSGDDLRYVLDTGVVFQGNANVTVVDSDVEFNRTAEFQETGDVVFVGDTTGLYAGVALNGGGLSDRTGLNAVYHGVEDGSPENVLYHVPTVPEGVRPLRDMLDKAEKDAGHLE